MIQCFSVTSEFPAYAIIRSDRWDVILCRVNLMCATDFVPSTSACTEDLQMVNDKTLVLDVSIGTETCTGKKIE